MRVFVCTFVCACVVNAVGELVFVCMCVCVCVSIHRRERCTRHAATTKYC